MFIISLEIILLFFSKTFIKIIQYQFNLNINPYISFVVVFIGLWPLFFDLKIIYCNEYKEKLKSIPIFILNFIKFSIMVYLGIILFFTCLNQILGSDLKYKTNYDSINYNGEEYVILTLINEKAIIGKYDSQNIYTNSYIIVDITDKVILLEKFESPPKIVSE